MLSLKFLLFAWHSLCSHHCHHNIYRPCRLMPVLVDWPVCPTHPHYEINLTKYHPIMSLFSKPHGLPMVPCILDSSSPLYFPLFSDKETAALSSWFLCSLQQSVLLPFSKSIFAQTVFLPGMSFSLLLPWLTKFFPAFKDQLRSCLFCKGLHKAATSSVFSQLRVQTIHLIT